MYIQSKNAMYHQLLIKVLVHSSKIKLWLVSDKRLLNLTGLKIFHLKSDFIAHYSALQFNCIFTPISIHLLIFFSFWNLSTKFALFLNLYIMKNFKHRIQNRIKTHMPINELKYDPSCIVYISLHIRPSKLLSPPP